MRQTVARGSGLAATLRRRWWIFPIILLLVAAGLVLRALNRNVTSDPVRVLDVLFDCQQLLLPRLMVA